MHQCNLTFTLIDQIITGGFGGKSVIKLNAVWGVGFRTIHQNDILILDIQWEAGTDNQHVIAQAAAQFVQCVHHFRFAVRKPQQQMFLVLTELLLQREKDSRWSG